MTNADWQALEQIANDSTNFDDFKRGLSKRCQAQATASEPKHEAHEASHQASDSGSPKPEALRQGHREASEAKKGKP